jgi:hypothetical protein
MGSSAGNGVHQRSNQSKINTDDILEKSTVDVDAYVQSIDQLGVCPVDFEDMLRGCCTVTPPDGLLHLSYWRVPGCLRKCKDDDKISPHRYQLSRYKL